MTQDAAPCVRALRDALEMGSADVAKAAAQRCVAAGADLTNLETVITEASGGMVPGSVERANALRAALSVLEQAWERGQIDPQRPKAPANATGPILLATLPGDRHDAGRHFWRILLRLRGYRVEDLGMRAPAIVVRRAEMTTTAIAVSVFDTSARPAVHSLVALLLRRSQAAPSFKVPLLLGGPGVDEAFSRWVAVPAEGTPYWGGVYFCEDVAQVVQVLKQIVLFEPPPPAHVHEQASPQPPDGCEGCEGCPLSGSCDSEPEHA